MKEVKPLFSIKISVKMNKKAKKRLKNLLKQINGDYEKIKQQIEPQLAQKISSELINSPKILKNDDYSFDYEYSLLSEQEFDSLIKEDTRTFIESLKNGLLDELSQIDENIINTDLNDKASKNE